MFSSWIGLLILTSLVSCRAEAAPLQRALGISRDMLPRMFQNATVFGKDDRFSAPRDYPYSAIGKLSIRGGRSHCTGTLIADDLVLTSRHCIENTGDNSEVKFFPNYPHEGEREFARVEVVNVVGEGSEKIESDWAVLKINKSYGKKYGTFDLPRRGDGDPLKQPVTLAGYSRDYHRGKSLGVHKDCWIRDRIQNPVFGSLLFHDCDMRPGASGGPLFTVRPDGRAVIRAINAAEQDKKGTNGNIEELPDGTCYEDLTANLAVNIQDILKELTEMLRQATDTRKK